MLLLESETQTPLQPASPDAQQVPLLQLPLLHWLLFWHGFPLVMRLAQTPLAQYLPAPQGTVEVLVQDPLLLHTDAVIWVDESLQVAAVQTVSPPG